MADGSVFELVSGILGPVDKLLDYLFYAGVFFGARSAARLVAHTYRGIRTYFIPFGRATNGDLSEKYGKWAVISGGTSGIGLAYARELARRRMNVVLISCSYDDLVTVISDIQSTYNVQTYGIYADFSLGARVYRDVEETLKDMEIGILVNNWSVRYDHPQYFSFVPHQRVSQIVNVNIMALTVMTHMLLPQMLERKRGAIINVCSVSACFPPTPLTAEYTASMAYVDTFSQTLHYENRNRGVCVQTLLPCFLTQAAGVAPTTFTPSADTYVRHAIATLGIRSRICGYWPHALQSWFCCLIPEWAWVWITRYFNAATRRRCLSEREAAGAPTFTRSAHAGVPPLSPVQGSGTRGRERHVSTNKHDHQTPSPHEHLRRTPSPGDKVHSDTTPKSVTPGTQRRNVHGRVSLTTTPDLKRRSGLEISRSRSSSTGSHVGATPSPPFSKDSASSSSLFNAEARQSAKSDRVPSPLTLPKRSSTSSSTPDSPLSRSSAVMRMSRVLVMPSVVMPSDGMLNYTNTHLPNSTSS